MANNQGASGSGGGQTRVQGASKPPPAASGTATQTSTPAAQAVLHLRGAPRDEQAEGSERRITWAEDVVDNEGLGRKKSKVCCIYHAPKGIDESSDESSSDSSDDSDTADNGAARPAGKQGCGHTHGGKGKGRARSPNAYEKIPRPKGSGSGGGPGEKP